MLLTVLTPDCDWRVAAFAPEGRFLFCWDRQGTRPGELWIVNVIRGLRKSLPLDFGPLLAHATKPTALRLVDVRPLSVRELVVFAEDGETRRTFAARMLLDARAGRFSTVEFAVFQPEDRLCETAPDRFCFPSGRAELGVVRRREVADGRDAHRPAFFFNAVELPPASLRVLDVVDAHERPVELRDDLRATTRLGSDLFALEWFTDHVRFDQLLRQSLLDGRSERIQLDLDRGMRGVALNEWKAVWMGDRLYVAFRVPPPPPPTRKRRSSKSPKKAAAPKHPIFVLSLPERRWTPTGILLDHPAHALLVGEGGVLIVDVLLDAFTHQWLRFPVQSPDTLRNTLAARIVRDECVHDDFDEWAAFVDPHAIL
ncbi:hypothetical protein M3Y99_01527900 [Aphelenchoides fujianensis]|nr:hypothetical protein M3Y99_01527900 [Aphelenchoides fujianensis]